MQLPRNCASWTGLWRYRVGDHRVICQLEDDQLLLLATGECLPVNRENQPWRCSSSEGPAAGGSGPAVWRLQPAGVWLGGPQSGAPRQRPRSAGRFTGQPVIAGTGGHRSGAGAIIGCLERIAEYTKPGGSVNLNRVWRTVETDLPPPSLPCPISMKGKRPASGWR